MDIKCINSIHARTFSRYLLVLHFYVRNIINSENNSQVTKFKCGGFILGVSINHCIADGISAMDFMNAWAEIARGKPLSRVPCHDRTILSARFPPQITGPYDDFVQISDVSNMKALYEEQQIVHKSFLFDAEKLAALKRMATKDDQVNFYLMIMDWLQFIDIFV